MKQRERGRERKYLKWKKSVAIWNLIKDGNLMIRLLILNLRVFSGTATFITHRIFVPKYQEQTASMIRKEKLFF